jgi:hypothetical protein
LLTAVLSLQQLQQWYSGIVIHTDTTLTTVITTIITTAAAKLKVLGSGFGLVAVGRTTMVVSVPLELSVDAAAVLQVAEYYARMLSYIQCTSVNY